MTSRQRGAALLLAALTLGRLLDRLDLPCERRPEPPTPPAAAPAPAALDLATGVADGPAAARADTLSRSQASRAPAAAPVSVNRASAADLQGLPGVGPVLAARILAYRTEHGRFRNLEDLCTVKGIGPRTCQKLAPLVRFD